MSNKSDLENYTVWRFEKRGEWSSHKGDYRGNWCPQVPRNIILRYSNEGDIVLDQFVGSGTTIIECLLLKRIGIGYDINNKAIQITKSRINNIKGKSYLSVQDARKIELLNNESIDLICTHPPYLDIIRYSYNIKEDLSNRSLEGFLMDIELVSKECYRVLKCGKFCTVMIGDIRKKGYVITLAYMVMEVFIKAGFRLKEIIIKEQFNCKSTSKWEKISRKKNFLLINHENIFVFRK